MRFIRNFITIKRKEEFKDGQLDENTIDDKFPYSMIGYATHSYNVIPTIKNQAYDIGTKLIGEATHSEFATYVTNIGLYNSERELLAVGTTGRPIKNDKELSLTFVVRFDTN